jgi:anti-anti-sigma factor
MTTTEFDPQSSPPTLSVTGELSFQTAADIRVALLEALDEASAALRIDLSAVDSFDLAGVQLLYAAHRSAENRGLEIMVSYGENRERFEKLYGFAGLKPIEEDRGRDHEGA